MSSGGVIASCPGQKGHCAAGVTATAAARLNELGRFARSVAIATQRWVIRSWRSWGIDSLGVLSSLEPKTLADTREHWRDRLELRQGVALEALEHNRPRSLTPARVVVPRVTD